MAADTLLDLVARVLRASGTASCMFLGITKDFASSSLLVTSCMCPFPYLACVYEFYILELPVLGSRSPFMATRKHRQVCKINYEVCQMLPEAHSTKSQYCGIISIRSWFISRPNRIYYRLIVREWRMMIKCRENTVFSDVEEAAHRRMTGAGEG
ncbi:unnamed protein product [Ascophyllum nodosum]